MGNNFAPQGRTHTFMSWYPERDMNNCYLISLLLLFVQLDDLGCMCCYIIGCLKSLCPIIEPKPKSQ